MRCDNVLTDTLLNYVMLSSLIFLADLWIAFSFTVYKSQGSERSSFVGIS